MPYCRSHVLLCWEFSLILETSLTFRCACFLLPNVSAFSAHLFLSLRCFVDFFPALSEAWFCLSSVLFKLVFYNTVALLALEEHLRFFSCNLSMLAFCGFYIYVLHTLNLCVCFAVVAIFSLIHTQPFKHVMLYHRVRGNFWVFSLISFPCA